MKFTSIVTLLLLLTGSLQAQSLSISSVTSNNAREYTAGSSKVLFTGRAMLMDGQTFSGVSTDVAPNGMAAVLSAAGASVIEQGAELIKSSYNIKAGDESAKIYAGTDGSFIIRENIANFLIYDSFGKIMKSVSNSSQSTEGESVSELAADPEYRTVVLFNPKIIRNGVAGSRVKLLRADGYTSDIFSSTDRAIRSVDVSANGQFLAVTTFASGTEDRVEILDKFGNSLNTVNFDRDIKGAQISDDGRYLMLYSNGRMAAYSVMNGDRLGSSSVRGGDIIHAEYIPQDDIMLAVIGEQSGNVISNVEFKAVNIRARKIASETFSASLGINDKLPVSLIRNGRYSYRLKGLSRDLNIRASF